MLELIFCIVVIVVRQFLQVIQWQYNFPRNVFSSIAERLLSTLAKCNRLNNIVPRGFPVVNRIREERHSFSYLSETYLCSWCKISSRNYRAGPSSRIREIPAVSSHRATVRVLSISRRADDSRLLPTGGCRPRAGCAGGLQSLPGTAALWTELRPRQGRGRLHDVRLSDTAALLSTAQRYCSGCN